MLEPTNDVSQERVESVVDIAQLSLYASIGLSEFSVFNERHCGSEQTAWFWFQSVTFIDEQGMQLRSVRREFAARTRV